MDFLSNVDIEVYLKDILFNEKLKHFLVQQHKTGQEGKGFVADVIFITVRGQTLQDQSKEYNLVLKCSKQIPSLRDTLSIKATFENEIYLYCCVFNEFVNFQHDKKLDRIFDCVPKCFGTFVGENLEILALQNLRSLGYCVNDLKNGLDVNHLNLIVNEYGKWHGISAAMQDQKPEAFWRLSNGIQDLWEKLSEKIDIDKFFGVPIEQICNLVRHEIGDDAKRKINKFRQKILFIMKELIFDRNYFCVLTHGDAWNDNFMFKYQDSDKQKPVKVTILDWQMSRVGNPVTDLSYLVYSCASTDGLEAFDDILNVYYNSFAETVGKLGSNPHTIYSFEQFLSDWKVFAKYGLMLSFAAFRNAISGKNEAENFEKNGQNVYDVGGTFHNEVKYHDFFKKRILCVINDVVKRGFI
ncbi:hypothetical protein Zmor_021162 [Zophobas morio]|uniref:CHK kinase-like domain-containing protein n=1 Tax=Zophobas morio TaxID=2755281 RepID=A0AA38MAV6_9CUCU|nr:hypothetical protein Zmor_021162 [Zophobas morio]